MKTGQLTKAEIFNQLEASIKRNMTLRAAGQICSNICYNLSQDSGIKPEHRELMRGAYKQWDEAINPESAQR